jgi:hypothetical protein
MSQTNWTLLAIVHFETSLDGNYDTCDVSNGTFHENGLQFFRGKENHIPVVLVIAFRY